MTADQDYKQIAFKLKNDIETLRWQNAHRDITFLNEMKIHAEKAFNNKDLVSQEMLFKMINDWIDELTQIENL